MEKNGTSCWQQRNEEKVAGQRLSQDRENNTFIGMDACRYRVSVHFQGCICPQFPKSKHFFAV